MPERTTGISGGISGRPARQELSNLQPAKTPRAFLVGSLGQYVSLTALLIRQLPPTLVCAKKNAPA